MFSHFEHNALIVEKNGSSFSLVINDTGFLFTQIKTIYEVKEPEIYKFMN